MLPLDSKVKYYVLKEFFKSHFLTLLDVDIHTVRIALVEKEVGITFV